MFFESGVEESVSLSYVKARAVIACEFLPRYMSVSVYLLVGVFLCDRCFSFSVRYCLFCMLCCS